MKDRQGETRPKIFTEKDLTQVKTMAGLGMPVVQIAAVLGMSKATFERRQNEQPEVAEAILIGRSIASAKVRQTAFNMAVSGTCPALTIFWLKCRERWKDTMEIEEPEITPVSELSPEEMVDRAKIAIAKIEGKKAG